MEGRIPCFVAGNKGYVWDADGAMRLRKKHRIMGCLVGSVSQFKNQNEVNHLPLELSADEITLAVGQGWIELFPETSASVRAAAARASAVVAASRGAGRGRGPGGQGDAEAHHHMDWEDAYHEYYAQFDPVLGFRGRFLPLLGAKRRRLDPRPAQQQQQQRQQRRAGGSQPQAQPGGGGPPGKPAASPAAGGRPEGLADSGASGSAAAAAPDCSEPGWRAAVSEGAAYTIPLTAAKAAAGRAGTERPGGAAAAQQQQQQQEAAGAAGALDAASERSGQEASASGAGGEDGGVGRVGWKYPSTPEERLQFDVFRDLHRQGYMMTGGIKFGSDLLAYPGDPSLYHAQFTVRPVPPGAALNPMVLKAAARGSHAARKHMLLAYYEDDSSKDEAQQQPRIKYLSFAPEAGFGSKA